MRFEYRNRAWGLQTSSNLGSRLEVKKIKMTPSGRNFDLRGPRIRAGRSGAFCGRNAGEKSLGRKMDIFDPSIGPNVGRNAYLKGLGQNCGVGMPLGRRWALSVAV